MTDREKLIALLNEAGQRCGDIECYDGEECEYAGEINGCMAFIADHLIANGVVVQRWIPVTERLPEAGKRVLATDGGFVGEFYVNAKGQWRRYNVNHHELLMALDILWWQDMPEPPKEDGAL